MIWFILGFFVGLIVGWNFLEQPAWAKQFFGESKPTTPSVDTGTTTVVTPVQPPIVTTVEEGSVVDPDVHPEMARGTGARLGGGRGITSDEQ